MRQNHENACDCRATSRRTFLSDIGLGFTGLALGSMLADDGMARGGESAMFSAFTNLHGQNP